MSQGTIRRVFLSPYCERVLTTLKFGSPSIHVNWTCCVQTRNKTKNITLKTMSVIQNKTSARYNQGKNRQLGIVDARCKIVTFINGN